MPDIASHNKPFQILSLSGGGFLGLYTISVIEKIEQQLGCPIARCFDLLAGTSVGGIIALGLAAEKPARQIREAFECNGTRIFSDRPVPQGWLSKKVDLLHYISKPKYSSDALKETVASIVGEDTTIGDLVHPVIIPAVNLTKGRPQVFKTPHHQTFKRDLHLKAVDVALATSAAPTYFPLAPVNDELFADGGLYANAPDLAALHEAEYFFHQQPAEVGMLSIGTTTSRFSFAHVQGQELGLAAWAQEQRLIRATLASQQLMTEEILRHKLGERYLRVDYVQSTEQERHLALDVATDAAQRTIRGLAESSYRESVNSPALARMLQHRASQPVFYDPATGTPLSAIA